MLHDNINREWGKKIRMQIFERIDLPIVQLVCAESEEHYVPIYGFNEIR